MTNEILKAFEEDLVADGKAKQTIISYAGDVRDFLKWLNNQLTGDSHLTY